MPSYKLTYFDAKARGEISRLIFAAAGVDYTDDRVKNWPAGKEDAPIGQLPYLTIDNTLKIPQSISIARFLAKRFNLCGTDDVAATKCDVIVDTLMDLKKTHDGKVDHLPEDQQREHSKKFFDDEGPKYLGNLEKLITLYGDGKGHSVGNSLTWSDLYILDVMTRFTDLPPNILNKFPHTDKVIKETETHPRVATWLKKRPITKW